MDRQQLINAFDFHNHLLFDQNVEPVSRFESDTFVFDWQRNLGLKTNIPL